METDSPPWLPGKYPVTLPFFSPVRHTTTWTVFSPDQNWPSGGESRSPNLLGCILYLNKSGGLCQGGGAVAEQSDHFWQPLSYKSWLYQRFWPELRDRNAAFRLWWPDFLLTSSKCVQGWFQQNLHINYPKGNQPAAWRCGWREIFIVRTCSKSKKYMRSRATVGNGVLCVSKCAWDEGN